MEKIISFILSKKNITALTGAGVSTLSGIPDFRSPGTGLWEKYGMEIFDIDGFYANPKRFYEFAKEAFFDFAEKEPSAVHKAIALAEKKGILKALITQNIDNLHQKAGSKTIYEVHGNMFKSYCAKCGKTFSFDGIKEKLKMAAVPYCDCGGLIKPDVIFFGEQLKSDVLNASFSAVSNCDLLLILGTSLVVYPAASLPQIAAQNNVPVVIINKTQTYIDSYALHKADDLKTFALSFLKALDEI